MEAEEWRQMERSGNTYHMNDIRWHEVDVGEVESTFSNTLDFLMKHSATISRTAAVHTMECSWVPSSSICPPHAHLTSFMWWVFPDLLHFFATFQLLCVGVKAQVEIASLNRPQATSRPHLTAVEKNQEKAWEHCYITGWTQFVL